MDDGTYRWRMMTERDWGEAGQSARMADRRAIIWRPPVEVNRKDREARGYWRLLPGGPGLSGSDTRRRGYIPSGALVPGATPGGPKSGLRGSQGKRVRAEYDLSADRPWTLWGNDADIRDQSSSSTQWSWWGSASWSGRWDWNEDRW